MRVSAEEKRKSRKRITEAAARVLRENGIAATGIAEVMQAAGMTHGGFYRHFSSKEDLVDIALEHAAHGQLAALDKAIARQGAREAVLGFLRGYLSVEHAGNPAAGCPLAALGAEAARGDGLARARIATISAALTDRLAMAVDAPENEARSRASALLSTMVGAVMLARLAGNAAEMETILADARRLAESTLGGLAVSRLGQSGTSRQSAPL